MLVLNDSENILRLSCASVLLRKTDMSLKKYDNFSADLPVVGVW